jgi:hypothetical protein
MCLEFLKRQLQSKPDHEEWNKYLILHCSDDIASQALRTFREPLPQLRVSNHYVITLRDFKMTILKNFTKLEENTETIQHPNKET